MLVNGCLAAPVKTRKPKRKETIRSSFCKSSYQIRSQERPSEESHFPGLLASLRGGRIKESFNPSSGSGPMPTTPEEKKNNEGKKELDELGVEPKTFRMLSERATNYATRPRTGGP